MDQVEEARGSFPVGCITAGALRTLANTMDRLSAAHSRLGGRTEDLPCLTTLWAEGGEVLARVRSGGRAFRLQLTQSGWVFR